MKGREVITRGTTLIATYTCCQLRSH